jgi:hypothetical protein
MPIRRKRLKWGRNWPCLCGSEKKYKKCCILEISAYTASDGNEKVDEIPAKIKQMIIDWQEEQKRKQEEEDRQNEKNRQKKSDQLVGVGKDE